MAAGSALGAGCDDRGPVQVSGMQLLDAEPVLTGLVRLDPMDVVRRSGGAGLKPRRPGPGADNPSTVLVGHDGAPPGESRG